MNYNSNKIIFRIDGMSCVNCEEKLRNALWNAEGVVSADVSYVTGIAEVVLDRNKTNKKALFKIVEDLGYSAVFEARQKNQKSISWFPFVVFIAIVSLYVPLQVFGLLNYLVPSELADSSMGFGMLFLIGVMTSVHCIAMCGGINLSQCIRKPDTRQKRFKSFVPTIFYNLGRVISYTVIGFILGFVGLIFGGSGSIGISVILQGAFKIIAGILMIIMGVNMLGLIPALRKINPRLPKFLAKKIGQKKSNATNPFIVGILNGIMPCGPLQSMWIVAFATGNPLSGALSMFLFALGTVPLMLGLGVIVTKIGQKFARVVTAVGALFVTVLGLAMLSQGGTLTGFSFLSPTVLATIVLTLIFAGIVCSIPFTSKTLKVSLRVTAGVLVIVMGIFAFTFNGKKADSSFDFSFIDGDIQIVKSELNSGSYPDISVVIGVPVRWEIQADKNNINGCNYKIIIPEFDMEYEFEEGKNVIEFTPTDVGSFGYSCWMGMINGTIVVTQMLE